MQRISGLSEKEINENHKRFRERISFYRKKGLEILGSREFIVKKARPLEGNILEIGCGKGYTTLCLAKAGFEFVAIDNNQERLRIAALNLAYENLLSHVEFLVMDGNSLSFSDSSFRSIFIVGLFHHIVDINRMLAEMDRILSANGRLVLADFNKKGMEIIASAHKEEARIHEDSGVSKNYVFSYFYDLGYEIEDLDDNCHWILIANKKLKNGPKRSL